MAVVRENRDSILAGVRVEETVVASGKPGPIVFDELESLDVEAPE
jgi:hypothetical protein